MATYFRDYLEADFQLSPMRATRLGDHRFDSKLDDVSHASLEKRQQLARTTLEQLSKKIDYQKLSRDGQIDFESFATRWSWTCGWISGASWRTTRGSTRAGDRVCVCTADAIDAAARDEHPEFNRRIRQVPAMLHAARANLKQPSRVRTETAIQQTRGAVAFYEGGILS